MEKTTVNNLAKQIRGVSYKPEDLHDSLDGDSIVLLRANNIDDGKINFDEVVYVDKRNVSNEQYLKPGDIFICASSGSKQLVGKAASVNFDLPCTFGAFCKVIRPNKDFEEYLGVYFQSSIYRRKISEVANGANINNIRNEHIDSLELPLYSTEIRHEIVKRITLAQKIIENRKNELSKLDMLIKARFVEMFGEPISNSKNLEMRKFGDICDLKAGDFTSAESIHEVQDEKYPYPCYGGNGIRGYVDNYNQEGDYPIIGRQGALCGNVQYATGKFRNTEHAVLVTPKTEMNKIWLYELLVLENLNRYHTGAAQPGLAVKTLNLVDLPFADINLQNDYAIFYKQVDKSKFVVLHLFKFQNNLSESEFPFPFPNFIFCGEIPAA